MHDLGKEAPPRELLERLVDARRLEHFINRRSPSFKANELDAKRLTKKEAIDWMMKDVNLIRRPILIRGDRATFGFDPDEFEKVLGS